MDSLASAHFHSVKEGFERSCFQGWGTKVDSLYQTELGGSEVQELAQSQDQVKVQGRDLLAVQLVLAVQKEKHQLLWLSLET